MKLDAFTIGRMKKFIKSFRETKAQLPTIKDFEAAGFSTDDLKSAEKQKTIESFYVTLTTGAVVKGFKIKVD